MRRTLSLRLRLALLVAGTTLPLIIFSAAIVYRNYQTDRRAESARVLELARGMTLAVDRELQSTVAALRVLGLSLALQRGDLPTFRQQAASFLGQYPEGANLIVADRTGQMVLNMALPESAPLPMRVNRETLERTFATGRPVVSDLFTGAVSGRPLISIDVPVFRDSEVAYAISFNPPLDVFTQIIRQQRPPSDWVVSVFDRTGINVARTPNPARFVGERASPSLLPRLLGAPEGVLETTSLEGIPLLTAFSRSPVSGWSVAVGVPRAALVEPLWQSLAVTVGTGLLFLLIGLAFALGLAARLARAEAHRELLINELNHRVKNTLATVQSIAARTLRGTASNAEAKTALESRLIALSGAHNVLSEDKWESADLRQIVARVLEPYALTAGPRLRIAGPELRIRPRGALTLALVLHELAINAAKYGALSNAEGRISISWAVQGVPGQSRLRLVWKEAGGPPVEPPTRKGFGSVLIERSLQQEFGGTADLAYEPSGLVCTLDMPTPALTMADASGRADAAG